MGALLTVGDHCAMDPASGSTVLHAAISSGNLPTVRAILDAFPEQMDTVNNTKMLPLHLACELGNVEVVKL